MKTGFSFGLLILAVLTPVHAFGVFNQCTGLSGEPLSACCTQAWGECRRTCAVSPSPYSQEDCEFNCDAEMIACQNGEEPQTINPEFPGSDPGPILIPSEEPYEIPSVPSRRKPNILDRLGIDGLWGQAYSDCQGGEGGTFNYIGENRNCQFLIGGGGSEEQGSTVCCRFEIRF